MLFKRELITKILTKEKTQTRRQTRVDDMAVWGASLEIEEMSLTANGFEVGGRVKHEAAHIIRVHSVNAFKTRFAVDATYAVQPGRGQSAVWYLRLDDGTFALASESTQDGVLLWKKAHEDKFTHDGKAHPEDWLRNNGFHPLRICVKRIRREDVRQISEADAVAEGFGDRFEFWRTWAAMYDKSVLRQEIVTVTQGDITQEAVDSIVQAHLNERPAKLYDAWALDFEVAT